MNRTWSQISSNEVSTRQDFLSDIHSLRDGESEGFDEIDGHSVEDLLANLYYPTKDSTDGLKSFYTLPDPKGKENPIFGIKYKEDYNGIRLPSTADNTWKDFSVL